VPRRLAWSAALLSGLLLGACEPAAHPSGPAGSHRSAQTTTRDPALWQELEHIERQARARPRELEQALQTLQAGTAPGSAERLEVLSLRGLMAGYLRDRALIDELLGQLRPWPVAASAPSAELAAAVMLSHFHQNKGDLRESLKALAPLEQERGKTRAPLLLLRAQATLAYVQADRGQMEAALAAALQAVKLAEGTGSHWRRALALNELARVYHRAQQIERAKQSNAEAWTEALLDPDPVLLNAVANMRGIAHVDDADSNVTLQAWWEALKYAREAGAEGLQALALANYADHYLRRGEFQRALALSEQALPLARRAQNLNAEIVALHNLGIAKIGLKQIDEGQRYVRQGITLDEQQGALSYAADGWKELGQYLEDAGAWSGAIEAHHQYRRLIDQVLRDETRKTVLEAQERYDDERRAKEIELLNRNNSLKAEQIRAHDLAFKLWAALAGCIVLSATLLGLAYQRIRRTNQALAHSNEHLKVQSERDPLTGLANRRHFQSAIKRLADSGKLAGTVYLIDIDHFKRINDQWGHAAGDHVLIDVAQRLRGALREDDLVVRWGGEEFLIVVPPRAAADAQQLAQRLLDLIATPAVPHGAQQIAVTASIGFASFPVAPHGLALSWERAIDLVDTVMYMAKAHGRNKAYGVLQIDARDEAGLIGLTTRMEAAWQAGQVKLVALQGPQEGPSA
jgi:diguanylate cyclase (GGDEF)-like protein